MIYSNGTYSTSTSTWDVCDNVTRWVNARGTNGVTYDNKYATKEDLNNIKGHLECSLLVLEDKFKKLENIVKEKYHISDEEFDELMKIGD